MMKLATTLVLLVATVPLLAKAWDFQKSLERLRVPAAAVVDGSGEAGTKSRQRARKLEEFPFRLRMHGIETEDWCIECEYHDVSGSQCFEGDKLVIDKCGISQRQWFVYEEAEPGIGRLRPQGSPNLCLTRDGHSMWLSMCNDDYDGQIFLGFDPVNPFELYPEGTEGDCVTQVNPKPTKGQEILVIDCVVVRDNPTSHWDVVTDTEAFTSQDKTSYGLNQEIAFASTESFVSADKSSYEVGESITITWNNQGTLSGQDWVALSYSSDGDETTVSKGDVLMWVYACGSESCSSGTASGTTTFVPTLLGGADDDGEPSWNPPAGASFKAVLMADNGYSVIAASEQISVVQSEPVDEVRGDESCPGVCLDVFQGGNNIGEFQPVSTDYSITTLYGYNKDNYSFNGDDVVPLVSDYSLVFIHHDSRTSRCDLSLVIVHDSKDTCSGGEVRMFITGDLEDSVVQDGRDSPSDTYIYDEETGETECFWEWGWQGDCDKRTDGIAHYWPNGKDCISVSAEFIRGIDEWQFVPGPVQNDGAVDPSDYIYLNKSRGLEICKREC